MPFFKTAPSSKPSSPESGNNSAALSAWPWLQDRRIQAALYFFIVLVHMGLIFAPFIQRLEFVFLDAFFRARPALVSSPDIVFVEIAQDSIEKIGRWPWPRRYHAALVSILNEWQSKAIVFDGFFSEPSLDLFDDTAFSEALAKTNNFYAGAVIEEASIANAEGRHVQEKIWVHSIPEIQKHLRGVGHVNVSPDIDGVTRRVELEMSRNGESHRYLGVEVAENALQSAGIFSNRKYPLDPNGALLINWADRWEKSFRHFSYWDVLQSYAAIKKGETPIVRPEDLKGKFVLIGMTAAGLTDIKGVPVQPIFPGVGVIANVMNSILINRFVYEADGKKNALVLLALALALALALRYSSSSRVVAWTTPFFIAAGWTALSFLIFCKAGIYFQVINPLLLILNFFVVSVVIDFLKSQNEQSILYQLATRDGLTGLYVIRHMRSLLEQAQIWALKKQHPVTVVMTDIDFFKKINDEFGHDAGDCVLKDVARLIELVLTEQNLAGRRIRVGRYGGEEFIILVEDCDAETAARDYAEPIRKRIESFPFNYRGKKIPMTLSLGIGQMTSGDSNPDDFVKRADAALYQAKRSGRNRVEISVSSSQPK